MKLHLFDNQTLFAETIEYAAAFFNLPTSYIEKDYFLTLALKNLLNFEGEQYVVFKGGTSLSKVYDAIDRFSEDIDIAILPDESWSDNQIKRFIKKVENCLSVGFEPSDEQFKNGSKFRKKRIRFPVLFDDAQVSQISTTLLLEINAYVKPTPYQSRYIESLIAQWALQHNHHQLVDDFNLFGFQINVLDWRRTFCEKLLGLMAAGVDDLLSSKIRHFYDVVMLLRQKEILLFVEDDAAFFELMALTCANDLAHRGKKAVWIRADLTQNPPFDQFAHNWHKLEKFYSDEFVQMVTNIDAMPAKDEIMTGFDFIIQRLVDYSASREHLTLF